MLLVPVTFILGLEVLICSKVRFHLKVNVSFVWLFPPDDTYERTLTVDGEDATLVVMDTWQTDKLVQ